MSNVLVKFQKNYADEFDVYGMRLMTNKELSEYLLAAEKATYPVDRSFGGNDRLEFNSFDDFIDTLEVRPLSDGVAQVIQDNIGDEWGWFPDFGDY